MTHRPLPCSTLIYDAEVAHIPPRRGEPVDPRYTYATSWDDPLSLGISVVCAYDLATDRFRVFTLDTLDVFGALVAQREHIVGFNSLRFDDGLLAAHGVNVRTTYDLLDEIRVATGQPRGYVKGQTRSGYTLGDVAMATLGVGKQGSGRHAPKLWQDGKIGAVIDYCLDDLALTRDLLRAASIVDPETTGRGERHVVLAPL